MNPSIPSPLHRTAVLAASLVVIAAGLHAAAGTVNLVLISLLIAMTLSPIPHLLGARGMKHGPAVALTVVGTLVGGALLVSALAAGLRGLQDKLPAYEASLATLLSGLDARLAAVGIDLHEAIKPDASQITAIVRNVASGALGALGYSVFAFILVALILAELPLVPAGGGAPGSLRHRFDAVGASVRRFVGLTGLIGGLQALLTLVVMLAVGTDFPLVWAVFFFLLTFVPFGFVLGMIPPLLVTLLEQGPTRAAILLGVTFVVNVVSDNVVKPKVMGSGLGLSPLAIVLSLMAWSLVLGPIGAILAVPLTIALTMILKETP